MLAEGLAVDVADRVEVLLVVGDVEHVDRELDEIGHLAAGRGDHRVEVGARLPELRHQIAAPDDGAGRVDRDLSGDEHDAPVLDLHRVGEAFRLRQRARPDLGDVVLHRMTPFAAGAVPSSTTVSPFVVSSATSRAAASATSSGSISRRPGFISASAFTASSNDLPVFATMLRAPLQTMSVATKPGQSAFTVTPLPETSVASARVKPTSACLEAG